MPNENAENGAVLPLLDRLADAVGDGSPLDEVLGPLLRGLSERRGLRRAALMLVDRTDGEVYIEAAHGLTPSETRRSSACRCARRRR